MSNVFTTPTDFKPPKAHCDQRVFAHNYKRKFKNDKGQMQDAGIWEWAKVNRVETRWHRDEEGIITYSHSYDVTLERTNVDRRGRETYLFLYLSEEAIQTEEGL